VKFIIAALLLGLTAGAAGAAPALPLPLPPLPPPHPPSDEAAPLPNADVRAPLDGTVAHTIISPRIFTMQEYDPGTGFIPGSQHQAPEERKLIQTPGFTVSVPLQ
jgi:hypothetical protein